MNLEKDTTTVSSGTLVILAPGDVRPGHMMFAPLRMNRIAPLSTCIFGAKNGSAGNKDYLEQPSLQWKVAALAKLSTFDLQKSRPVYITEYKEILTNDYTLVQKHP